MSAAERDDEPAVGPSDRPDGVPAGGELGADAVDAAWADIVARWDGRVPSPDDGTDPPDGRADPVDGAPVAAAPPSSAAPLPRPGAAAGPRDHELAEEDESFVPPVPPPLARVRPVTWLPWAGVLGGPVLLVLAVVLYGAVPPALLALAVAAFCGGAVLLVLRLPARRDDDGDDGAVV